MDLMCGECGNRITKKYQVLSFLGHSKTGLVEPKYSLFTKVICPNHSINQYAAKILSPQTTDIDDLIFAITPCRDNVVTDREFYDTIEQTGMAQNANYDQSLYVSGDDYLYAFPESFKELLTFEFSDSYEMKIYKKAVDYYRENLKQERPKERYRSMVLSCKNKLLDQLVPASRLFRAVYDLAQQEKSIPLEIIAKFIEANYLKPSSGPRKSRYLGEAFIVFYEFLRNGKKYNGYFGLDDQKKLIVIEERMPFERHFYRKGSSDNPEWVEMH